MNSNSTLLIELSPQGNIEIIDLNELLFIENNFSDVFIHIDKMNKQPSQDVIKRILAEL